MNITKEQIDELNAVVKIQIDREDYETQVEKSLKDYGKKISLPGFRPGKVPAGLVKKMHGKAILAEEINKILSGSIDKYISENQIEILGNPLPKRENELNIDWINPKNLEFSFELGLVPKFNVDINHSQHFDYSVLKIDEEMVEKEIDNLRRSYGKIVSPEITEASHAVYAKFEELDAHGNILEKGLSHTTYIFIEKVKHEQTKNSLVGLKKDDHVVVIPKNISENETDLAATLGIKKEELPKYLNNKFRLSVINISKIELAELNQELFDKVYGEGQVNSEADFREKVIESLKSRYARHSDNKLFKDMADYLIHNTRMPLPDEFLKRWMMATSEKPISAEQVNHDYHHFADDLKWQLIKNKIVKENYIEVTEDEIRDYLKMMIKYEYLRYGHKDVTEEQLSAGIKKFLENQAEMRKIHQQLYENKIFVYLKNACILNTKEIPYSEFLSLVNQ